MEVLSWHESYQSFLQDLKLMLRFRIVFFLDFNHQVLTFSQALHNFREGWDQGKTLAQFCRSQVCQSLRATKNPLQIWIVKDHRYQVFGPADIELYTMNVLEAQDCCQRGHRVFRDTGIIMQTSVGEDTAGVPLLWSR